MHLDGTEEFLKTFTEREEDGILWLRSPEYADMLYGYDDEYGYVRLLTGTGYVMNVDDSRYTYKVRKGDIPASIIAESMSIAEELGPPAEVWGKMEADFPTAHAYLVAAHKNNWVQRRDSFNEHYHMEVNQ